MEVATTTPDSDAVPNNAPVEWSVKTQVGAQAKSTVQSWRRDSINEPFYEVDENNFQQRPLPHAPLVTEMELIVSNEAVRISQISSKVLCWGAAKPSLIVRLV